MAKYVEIEEARGLSGLRLVLTAGVPGPYSESARYLFDAKKIPYVRVRQAVATSDDELRAWTAQTSAPVAVWEDERPRSSWIEILFLAERMAPTPALIPADPADRVRMFGLATELCGDLGLGWQRRLIMLQPMMEAGGGPTTPFAAKYGYSAEAAAAAPARCVEIMRLLSDQITIQRGLGRNYLIGDSLSALDLYWAAFSQMVQPLPDEQSPTPDRLRGSYTVTDPELLAAVDPALFEHRDRVFAEHIGLPLDF